MFVISGPGGVGKSTIATELARRDASLWLSRSWTTRSQRPGEAPDAYSFVSRPRFEQAIEEGTFLEWAEFAGNLYGTPYPDDAGGRDVLLEIDVQGAEQVRRRHPGAVVILVVGPSWEATAERLEGRGDTGQSRRRRLEIGRHEEEAARRIADHVVVNDDLDETLTEMAGIIAAHRRP